MRYANIIYNDLVNTDGVALCFYTQGCSHHCKGCFSQSTWDYDGGHVFGQEDIKNLTYAFKNYQYDYLCLIGGEPMDNVELCNIVIDLYLKYQHNGKVWTYSGYTWEELTQFLYDTSKYFEWMNLLRRINILVDGKFEQELYDAKLKFRGSSNQRIINVPQSLLQNKPILYLP